MSEREAGYYWVKRCFEPWEIGRLDTDGLWRVTLDGRRLLDTEEIDEIGDRIERGE